MKKPKMFTGLVSVALLAALLALGVQTARCEPQVGLKKAHSQVKSRDAQKERYLDQEGQDEKSQRFKMLEWAIRESLMKQYEKLAVNEDLEPDNLD